MIWKLWSVTDYETRSYTQHLSFPFGGVLNVKVNCVLIVVI